MFKPQAAHHTAYIAMGSNLSDRLECLRQGATALAELSRESVSFSSLYETDPVGYLHQPRFLNLVARIAVDLTAMELLHELHRIEAEAGRVRDVRFGPRTLDLDILLYDDDYVCCADLQIPHPRMWRRAFVLVPLAELAPQRRGLGGMTMVEMALRERRKEGIQYVGNLWSKA